MAKKDSIAMLEAKIEVLKRARNAIQTGEEPFICWALSHVATKNKQQNKAVNSLLRYVEKSLGDSTFLSSWVRDNRPKLYGDAYSKENANMWRLKWIDWMIGCLQEDLQYKQAKEKAK